MKIKYKESGEIDYKDLERQSASLKRQIASEVGSSVMDLIDELIECELEIERGCNQ